MPTHCTNGSVIHSTAHAKWNRRDQVMHNMSKVDTNWWWILGALCALLAASCSASPSSSPRPAGTPFPETPMITTPITSAGCGKPAPTPPGSSVIETALSGGLTRTYLLHVPSGYQAHSSEAVVLNFHGHSSNAIQQERRSGMSLLADQQGFIAVYPQGFVGPAGRAGRANARWLHHGANGFLPTSQGDGAGVDTLPGKCNRCTIPYSRRRPSMAFSSLQGARRNYWNSCKSPQRFGPDLVVFPAASSDY